MTYVTSIPSPLGLLYISSDGAAVTGLWIEGQKYFAATLGTETRESDLPLWAQVHEWLSVYFSGKQPDFLPPLNPQGSAFRQSVWDILLAIPYGEVITYGDIAKQLASASDGKRVSAQAVGGAVGHNPISIIIPCHRVVGVSGSLTGYASGIERKIQLLKLEGARMDNLFVPKKGTAL